MHEFKEFLEHCAFPEPSKLEVSQKLLADRDLYGNTLRALLMIDYFTRPSGFCDVDNRTLERQFPKMNGNLFKYYLSNLQKKGALFKKIKPIPKRSGGGSKRILVIENHWVKCHKYWLKKGYFQQAAELESYFTKAPVDFLLFKYSAKNLTTPQTLRI